jgi:CheY-like chemotaxis protein
MEMVAVDDVERKSTDARDTAAEAMVSSALVIDDDDGLRELLEIILEGEGVHVESAANGKEALDRMRKHVPRLILLDMRMPVMDGWEFVRELDRCGASRPPIVVVTAATNPAQRAEEVHADAWLAKPFERRALLNVVHRFLDAA